MLQVLFFGSQVIYPLQSIQQSWLKYLLAINPVNAAIELFRAPLSSTSTVDWAVVSIGAASTISIVLVGLFFFKKTEAYFADLA
jgi:lipopolysaccharide transport system permease protein